MRFLFVLLLVALPLLALGAIVAPRFALTPMPIAGFRQPQAASSSGPADAPRTAQEPGTPFEPEQFFDGRTVSAGVIESPDGEPLRRIRTATRGTLAAGVLVMEQTLTIEGEPERTRQWQVSRRADGVYVLACDDMAEPAIGHAAGRSFRMEYDLQLAPDSSIGTVHATHWMHLQDDGKTMLNRVVFTKLGVVVATVSESFHRLEE